MTYAYVQDLSSSWVRYQEVATGLVDPRAPGLILHVAGPTGDGVRIIDVWDSRETGDRFRVERLLPVWTVLDGTTRVRPVLRELVPEHVVLPEPPRASRCCALRPSPKEEP